MSHEDSRTGDEVGVRAVIEAMAAAVRAKDVEAMLSLCTPDVATFDLVPPLAHEGAEAVRRIWSRALAGFVPPLEYDVHRLEVFVDGDVAFTRSLTRFGGAKEDGERSASWLRSTLGLRRIDGHWKVAHEHVSVPFDMESGKALLDLTL
ncbi:MAG TPA: SgcJ/EcaC family oxidoreductase [Longimicrobiaceae bacterium]|nr:SgcJ/EcaC family oxidoreductase [Longimicrobiaceae bacterium]